MCVSLGRDSTSRPWSVVDDTKVRLKDDQAWHRCKEENNAGGDDVRRFTTNELKHDDLYCIYDI